MAPLAVTTLTGDTVSLEAATLAAFTAELRGPILCPTDAGYEAARTIWNAHITTRPALIVRCVGVADVLASITAPECACVSAVRQCRQPGPGRGHSVRAPRCAVQS
jgi:hypothetical protein